MLMTITRTSHCIKNASSIIEEVEYAVRHFPDFAKANGIDGKYIDEIGEYLKNRVLVQSLIIKNRVLVQYRTNKNRVLVQKVGKMFG